MTSLKNKKDAVIIAAAGSSTRMGRGAPKVFRDLCGAPVLIRAMEPILKLASVRQVIVAVRPEDTAKCEKLLRRHDWPHVQIVAGCGSRPETVRRAFEQLDPDTQHVIIHDGARPNASIALWRRVLSAARRENAAIPIIPVTDTLKTVEHNFVTSTISRTGLFRIQTPQAFSVAMLARAYKLVNKKNLTGATDEAVLLELAQIPINTVPGEQTNIKITHETDFTILETLFLSLNTY